jgi:glyoxylase-like metal-dependent hydrolase (beta-lactamase superfamily II)
VSDTSAPLQLQVVVAPAVEVSVGGTFSPTTATIITGSTEAVLVDTLYTPADVERLAQAVEATGKRLTTIYVTHAHFDHYIGLGTLLERFPAARGVSLPSVAEFAAATHKEGLAQAQDWLPGKIVENTSVLPQALDGDTILIDGHELRAIEVGQGDIPNSTVLYVPSLRAVVAGDVIYNGVHQMMGVSAPSDWPQWIASVDKIAALDPELVIAGHKHPELSDDDIPSIVGGTREYIEAFIEEFAATDDTATLIGAMTKRFPGHINPATLHFSASAAIRFAKNAAASL